MSRTDPAAPRHLRALASRREHLDGIISGQEAIGRSTPRMNYEKAERSALAWAIEQLSGGETIGDREVQFGSRKAHEHLRAFASRRDRLADIIAGAEAIGRKTPAAYWQRAECDALIWALSVLEPLDRQARAEKAEPAP